MNLLQWWRTLGYARREGEYRRQIAVLTPTRKERLKLPAIRPLRAEKAHVLSHVTAFKKRG